MENKKYNINHNGCVCIQDAVTQCTLHGSLPLVPGISSLVVVKQELNVGGLCIIGPYPAMGKTGFVFSLMAVYLLF